MPTCWRARSRPSSREKLGQQFIVDNRAGAGGNIGGAAVAKAAPDGYTFMFGTPGPIATNKLMYKNLPYDPEKDLTPVVLVAKSPLIVVAHPSFPAKDLKELIAYAKANPDKVNAGNPGNGTLGHITSELLQQHTGTKMMHVPYRGTAPLMTDLLGGQINVGFDFMPTYIPLVSDGKLRALAVTSSAREPSIAECHDRAGGRLRGLRGDRVVRDRRADRHAGRRGREGQRDR